MVLVTPSNLIAPYILYNIMNLDLRTLENKFHHYILAVDRSL